MGGEVRVRSIEPTTVPQWDRMKTANLLTETLSKLSVPQDRVLYVHSSMNWLTRADISLRGAVDALIDWTQAAGGTLVFPAFPFRGSHEAYLRSKPTFDVRRTPARVGLLNETVRRRRGVKRSLDPDLSVIALGPHADLVVGTGFTGPDPTGPDSPFQRIIKLGGMLAGLGVSLNYMNMIHVLDSRYRQRYPFDIYSPSIYVADAIDAAGCRHTVAKHAMLNELQMHIKPSLVVQLLRPGHNTFRSLKVGDTDFFVWDLPSWERLCVAHAEQTLDDGGFPCWLGEVARRVDWKASADAEGRAGARPAAGSRRR
jgi:aminoglycoside N3'-acetyltransferase